MWSLIKLRNIYIYVFFNLSAAGAWKGTYLDFAADAPTGVVNALCYEEITTAELKGGIPAMIEKHKTKIDAAVCSINAAGSKKKRSITDLRKPIADFPRAQTRQRFDGSPSQGLPRGRGCMPYPLTPALSSHAALPAKTPPPSACSPSG